MPCDWVSGRIVLYGMSSHTTTLPDSHSLSNLYAESDLHTTFHGDANDQPVAGWEADSRWSFSNSERYASVKFASN